MILSNFRVDRLDRKVIKYSLKVLSRSVEKLIKYFLGSAALA